MYVQYVRQCHVSARSPSPGIKSPWRRTHTPNLLYGQILPCAELVSSRGYRILILAKFRVPGTRQQIKVSAESIKCLDESADKQ